MCGRYEEVLRVWRSSSVVVVQLLLLLLLVVLRTANVFGLVVPLYRVVVRYHQGCSSLGTSAAGAWAGRGVYRKAMGNNFWVWVVASLVVWVRLVWIEVVKFWLVWVFGDCFVEIAGMITYLLLVVQQVLLIMLHWFISCLDGREVLRLVQLVFLRLVVLLQQLYLRQLRTIVLSKHTQFGLLYALVLKYSSIHGASLWIETHQIFQNGLVICIWFKRLCHMGIWPNSACLLLLQIKLF